MTPPDTAEAVRYRPSRARTFLAAGSLLFVGSLVTQLATQALRGEWHLDELLPRALVLAVPLTLVFVLVGAGRGWEVVTSGETIELVPPKQGMAQSLPSRISFRWDEIAAPEFRHRWIWRSLVVRPKRGEPVTVRTAFLRPGERALRADLAQRQG